MFKKIITGILAAATLTLSAVPYTFAVTATTPFTHVNNGKHAEGSLVLYSYNVPATTNDYVSLTNRSTGKTTDVQCSSFVYHPVSYTFDKNAEFTSMVGSSLSPFGGSGTAPSIDMATSAGRYEKVRIKLSDFDSEFNNDGSITKSVDHSVSARRAPIQQAADLLPRCTFSAAAQSTMLFQTKTARLKFMFIAKSARASVTLPTSSAL